MKIKSWTFENYKSFGGMKNTITLNPNKGELILMNGENGTGKSAIWEALDVSLYGETLNKRGTRLSKKNYPNWINKNLKVSAIIETQNRELEITRTMKNETSSMKTEVSINGVEKTPAKVDDFIVNELQMDFDTFKSFCSINVSHFKNFISLTPNDKRMILDKLFNMQQINDLNKIFKQLRDENTRNGISIKSKIETYKENIAELNESITEFLNEQKDNTKDLKRIETLNKEIADIKTKIKDSEKEITSIENTIEKYEKAINKLNLKVQNYNRDIKDIDSKIDLYSLGKCPTCSHDLVEELNLLPGLEEEKEKTQKLIKSIKEKINLGNTEMLGYKSELRTINSTIKTMNSNVSKFESEIMILENKEEIDVSTFEKKIEGDEKKLKEAENEYIEIEKLNYIYDVLSPIWTNDGIKKRIIESIIDPINAFIREDLERIKLPYTVELDDKFDAHIYRLMEEIDVDALSSGETRKINLIIMLAYIKMMRMNNDLNLLILDEVFTTIDLQGIDEVLHILKEFAEERLISIFVVHHTELKEYYFDRIFNISKPYFSIIDEK